MILGKNDCKLTLSYFSGCGYWFYWLCTVNDCNSNLITAIWLYKGCTLTVSICSVATFFNNYEVEDETSEIIEHYSNEFSKNGECSEKQSNDIESTG